jgi:hypothetical protein
VRRDAGPGQCVRRVRSSYAQTEQYVEVIETCLRTLEALTSKLSAYHVAPPPDDPPSSDARPALVHLLSSLPLTLHSTVGALAYAQLGRLVATPPADVLALAQKQDLALLLAPLLALHSPTTAGAGCGPTLSGLQRIGVHLGPTAERVVLDALERAYFAAVP